MRRKILLAVRWSAWIVLLSVILTQIMEEPIPDRQALGMFVIAALLYAISIVLEQKYRW